MTISEKLYHITMTIDEARIAFNALDLLKSTADSDFTATDADRAAIIRADVHLSQALDHHAINAADLSTVYNALCFYQDAADLLEVAPSESDMWIARSLARTLYDII